MTTGTSVSDVISVAGEQDHYGFTLTQDTRLYFDAMTNSSQLNWTLQGPRGLEVSSRRFDTSDSNRGLSLLDLIAGDYVISISATTNNQSYTFNILDFNQSTLLTPGVVVSGQLNPASETDIYRFDAVAGEQYYFDRLSSSASTYWRLIDPHGRTVFGPSYMNSGDPGVKKLQITGTYSLLIEGYIGDTGTRDYSFNVQNVVNDTATLSLGTTVSGDIAHTGQQDFYNFSLLEASRLYFDSQTNSSNLKWSLSGPRGLEVSTRGFNSNDWGYSLLDLPMGDYTLTVKSNVDYTGSYDFNLLDVSQATPFIAGEVVSGQLNPANETDVYSFTVTAGDSYFFDRLTSSYHTSWRLLDPYGRTVFGSAYMNSGDIDAQTLNSTGTYTLLIEGRATDTGVKDYSFSVQQVTNETALLSVGDLINGDIDHPGQIDSYSFSLLEARQLYFDSQTNDSGFRWTLTGPRGVEVNSRSFSTTEWGQGLLDLPVGEYTLVVDGSTDTTGAYSFRLIDLNQASAITLGVPVVGQLNPANESHVYQFVATAGEQYFFDRLTSSYYTSWRLLDPYGRTVFGSVYMNSGDIDTRTLDLSGTYTLLIEGRPADTGVRDYSFNIQQVTNEAALLTVGDLIDGDIDHQGQIDSFTFSLLQASELYFDSQTNSNSFNWTLTGPRGVEVNSRSFSTNEWGQGLLDLPAGDYTLVVDGSTDATGAYSFRLIDLSQASVVTPGIPVVDQLNPANETHVYQFDAIAGEQYFFDRLTSEYYTYWRLLDPSGRTVFGSRYMNSGDIDTLTLNVSGNYTLLIEGRPADTGVKDYSFNVQKVTDETRVLVLGESQGLAPEWGSGLLNGGVVLSDTQYVEAPGDPSLDLVNSVTLEAWVKLDRFANTWTPLFYKGNGSSGQRTYSVWINSDGSVHLSTGDGSDQSITTGTQLIEANTWHHVAAVIDRTTSEMSIYIDGAMESSGAVRTTAAISSNMPLYLGNTIENSSSYGYLEGTLDEVRIWNVARTEVEILANKDVELTGAPGPELVLHLNANEGAGNSLLDSSSYGNDATIESYYGAAEGVVVGQITHPGQEITYNFTLAGDRQLYFDSMTSNNGFSWTLSGPRGVEIVDRGFASEDRNYKLLNLSAGDYSLTIDGSADSTGRYSFRFIDLSQAVALTPGTVVSSDLNPANETDIYQFSAAANERFYFDQLTSNYYTSWRLLDPYGNTVFGSPYMNSGDIGTKTLEVAGTYTLLIEGASSDVGVKNYSFNVQPVSDDFSSISVASLVSGEIEHAGQQDNLSFSLTEPMQLYFDSQTSRSDIRWMLTGPAGTEVPLSAFNLADWSKPILDLPAGDYTITVNGLRDATGSYAFRLIDLSQAVELTPDTPVSGQLDPASETDVYYFDAVVGDKFFFDQLTSQWYTSWRLIDPFGRNLFGPSYMNSGDVADKTLLASGRYMLLIEGNTGDSGTRDYSFNVVYQGNEPQVLPTGTPIVPGDNVAGLLSVSGEQDHFTFSLAADTTLYFDSLTNNQSLNWSLLGPRGIEVTSRNFHISDALNGLSLMDLVAGDYVLTVSGTASNASYSFKLHDLGQSTVVVPGTAVAGQLNPANESETYQFAVTAGEQYYFERQVSSWYTSWRLVDPFGRSIFGPNYLNFGDIDAITLDVTGIYTLLIEGRVSDTGARSYGFNVHKVTNEISTLTVGTTVNGDIAQALQQDFYNFSLTDAKRIYFDSQTNDPIINWSLSGPSGVTVSGRGFNSGDYGLNILNLVPGDYTITVKGSDVRTGAYSFRLLDLEQATQFLPGVDVSGQLNPANSTDIYEFDAIAGEQFYFDRLVSSYATRWRVLDPDGKTVFNSVYLNSGDIDVRTLNLTGNYVLLIEGAETDTGIKDYSFNVQPVSNDFSSLSVGDVVTGDLAHAGQQDTYTFTLDATKRLYFDSQTNNSSYRWTLTDTQNNQISSRSFSNDDWGIGTFELEAGDYTLRVDGVSDATGAYAFKVFDLSQAISISTGTVISSQLNPGNETDVYQFDASAGERFYFDRLSSSYYTAWRLLDPYDRTVFNSVYMNYGDIDVTTLELSGTYTLLIEGRSSDTGTKNYSFNVSPVPPSATLVISGLGDDPGADLVVQGLTITPLDGALVSGSQIRLNWDVVNTGTVPVVESWQDRILVRNTDLSSIVGNYLVNYDDLGSFELQPGGVVSREVTISLPDGNQGAGNLSFQITTDVANTIAETAANAELNNTATVDAISSLAQYPDLQISNVQVAPGGAWVPGSNVTVSWRISNTGDEDISGEWTDNVYVRNLTSGQVLSDANIRYSQLNSGVLAAGEFRDFSHSFIWPQGTDSTGRFEFVITADALSEIFENNLTGTAEENNSASLMESSGPDLTVKNLTLVPGTIQAGGLVTITWEDWNDGEVSIPAGFTDRIVVNNVTIGQELINTSLIYDPETATEGYINTGEFVSRSLTFRLPDGINGAGDIEITVTTDRNTSNVGALFENNETGDAETNNSATIPAVSEETPYADLAVVSITAPVDASAGTDIDVSWTVENRGNVSTSPGWTDRLILTVDGVVGNSDDVILANVVHTAAELVAGSSYVQTATVRLPSRIDGNYFFAVITDTEQTVTEPDTRTDNTLVSPDAINILAANSDLLPELLVVPTEVTAGRSATIEWQVSNIGSIATDVSLWVDQVYLSASATLDNTAILLSSVTHVGALSSAESYSGSAEVLLPRQVSGSMYFIVKTDAYGNTYEAGETVNNVVIAATPTLVNALPKANLQVTDVQLPAIWTVGETVTIDYTVENFGNETADTWLTDRIRLVEIGNETNFRTLSNAGQSRTVVANDSYTQSVTVVAPDVSAGSWRVEVLTDVYNYVDELVETDNTATQDVTVIHPDVTVSNVSIQGVQQGGESLDISWTTTNTGSADAGGVIDQVYLSRDGVLDSADIRLGEFIHGSILSGESASANATVMLPVDALGSYELLVVTDTADVLNETSSGEANNVDATTLDVAPDYFADLAVSNVVAPSQVIDDPATVNLEWTVTNQGTGPGRSNAWTDIVVFSRDEIIGNFDDVVLAEVRHETGLATGASYTGSASYTFGPAFSDRGHVYVRTDANAEVWENNSEDNNTQEAASTLDVISMPYADLQVNSVSAVGAASSGKPLTVSWTVVNNGIGITNSGSWSDRIWLSSNADGSGIVTQFSSSSHIGALAPAGSYTRSVDVVLPEGISGTYYINVETGGPYEFIYTDNNTGSSMAIPVELSLSPDLVVSSLSIPQTAQEGALIDVSWTVQNQGDALADGIWVDRVILVPTSGGANVTLGNFSYDRGLEPGIQYTRTEQVRLPSRIEGLYRVELVTNVNLGGRGDHVYEHGAAGDNNSRLSAATTEVSLNDRPDLRVNDVEVPTSVTAGTTAAIQYTVINQGSVQTSGKWTDRVYLSLDGTLSGDDQLVGTYENGSALAPTESYSNVSASIDIPIRYRGNVYLLVVADGNNNVNEYPNEQNNVGAAQLYVDPIPFADLVTSDVVAPDQAVHGSTIEVRYQVSNSGSNTTLGDSANVDSWTDTIWLARDKTRPSVSKGDILIGRVTHQGNLAVGENYLGTTQVTIPEGVLSGEYFITVWSDAYDVILEDTLASNINTDDPFQIDNNNYKARDISILGITPPDLVVSELSAIAVTQSGGEYSFSYTVKNEGDLFTGSWIDEVYITNNPDLNAATERWRIGRFDQQHTLANGEEYSVNQTVQLAPSVEGTYLVVKLDIANRVKEHVEDNNIHSESSQVIAPTSDLQVTEVVTQPDNLSGEETTVSWTVTNFGADVWGGTQGWIDRVFISSDPEFIPQRSTHIGSVVHSNIDGLLSGQSYTTTTNVTLPAGTEGSYYIYVITDARLLIRSSKDHLPERELEDGSSLKNDGARNFYANSVYEAADNQNNIGQGTLDITYYEPDLQVDSINVSNPTPSSGEQFTVTWTVTNYGTRETRTNTWFDGVYLSQDTSLDNSDYPAVDSGSLAERRLRVRLTQIPGNTEPEYLKVGESYTNSATFNLPDSISGDYHVIVKADTSTFKDPYKYTPSSIRDDLDVIRGSGPGAVGEFEDEGNNVSSIPLTITLTTPPDLQVAAVNAPANVLAGQPLQISYQVRNAGGDTPIKQDEWFDLIYLSRDRFLDVSKDRYLGYVAHKDGLTANATYDAALEVTAPRDLEGAYYVFVVTDPANTWGKGSFGSVREFGNEQNNAGTTVQPILIETPPPADLVVSNVVVPASAVTGEDITIDYTIQNDSINQAYGNWTDALYLSSDNEWDLGDRLLGKVEHFGGLNASGSYSGSLTAQLPPLKDGDWRVIVRPDLFNEVYEGPITYTDTGLNIAPGEANNRIASGSTLEVVVPELAVASPLDTTLSEGQSLVYKVSVAAGETLRVDLDSSDFDGANELYIRYGDIPTGFAFDASYSNPVSPDQQVLIPTTEAGDYYILVKSREGDTDTPVVIRADLLPLSITRITPDQGGTGDDDHRWVTVDIHGASFEAGALVKLARPGIFEIEPERWQVLDATHIRAVFDLRGVPHGLYDVVITNPDGQHVTEPYRYLVERAIEADVTIGIGGNRTLNPGDGATYSVSLQSLTNVDTPYVRFDFGAPNMGDSDYILENLSLPFIVYGSNVAGEPNGAIANGDGNNQSYGPTPTTGTPRDDIPWASLDGVTNTSGVNLASGYAIDVAGNGFVGMSFNIQTYPGLAEWMAYDFEGFRAALYTIRPDWAEQDLLAGGVESLDNIASGLTRKYLFEDEHITDPEALAMPFRFNIAGAAVPLTRSEFIAEQEAYAKQLRTVILADTEAPASLSVLAADESQWVQGWLGALEAAGLLRPADEAAPVLENPEVVSLNATLASGILLSKGGEVYRTQADILGFFSTIQTWYGDTAKYAGDPDAAVWGTEYVEVRVTEQGDQVEVPVPEMVGADFLARDAAADTHFINFNVFAGAVSELEYLRYQGLLDADFNPIGPQALNLSQYLQQSAQQNVDSQAIASIRGPQGVLDPSGNTYVPANTPLPYTVSFNNPDNQAQGELRIVSELDADLDPRSFRLGDLKIGDINIHMPTDRANFQGDFDFSGNKGFILRVSAGVDASTNIATWLLQAIDPDTGEVLQDSLRGLLAPSSDPTQATTSDQLRGYVNYTVVAAGAAESGSEINAGARVFFADSPPVETASLTHTLDSDVPVTEVAVTSLGSNAQGDSSFDVSWNAVDDSSGVKHVTVYVAENGGDFKIWLRQVSADQTQAIYSGNADSTYEFLAVATDYAGNLEAAIVANAVLPDDGSRQDILDSLGVQESVTQSGEIPAAAEDRSYASNDLFEQSTEYLPGYVAPAIPGDLQTVVAPFMLQGFAEGFSGSTADIGALAMVELADNSILVSAGQLRNEVFRYSEEGGRNTTPLFTLNAPVMDMALDAVGQLWVLTGNELLLIDAVTGNILETISGPGNEPLTHALAIDPQSGEIYVTSGDGVEIYNPDASDANQVWRHFSNTRMGDLGFGPDGRLWGVRWTGSEITGADPAGTTDIVSFSMSGRTIGRAELEYRIDGVVDSIAFGGAGTQVEGLLFASSNLQQRALVDEVTNPTPHESSVWMVELQSRRIVQLATGGTRGESIITTQDGRILVAQSDRVDQIAPLSAPSVLAVSVPDGSLLPLPVNNIAVSFDQAMWLGEGDSDLGSVLNPDNYVFTALGQNSNLTLTPEQVTWDAATRSVVLRLPSLSAGQYQLEISGNLQSQAQVNLATGVISTFTAVFDMSSSVSLDFTNTRADRATGEVSYDVTVTNIGVDDIRGPMMLLLDPGRYFQDNVSDAVGGTGEQSDLWMLDLNAALQALGGTLGVGSTLQAETITVQPDIYFGTTPGAAELAKFNLGHGIYALPYDNTPPVVGVSGDLLSTTLPEATAGQAWSAQIEAQDADGSLFYWQLLQAPAGVTLTPSGSVNAITEGYSTEATLSWSPTSDDRVDSEILVRVHDSRGGVATKRFQLNVAGANNAPVTDSWGEITLTEGEALNLPITAVDADGDALTVMFRNLPDGASYNAETGFFSWVPGYDQAGRHSDVTIVVSDGKATIQQTFDILVTQGYAKPELAAIAPQTLREGDNFALQLAGSMPGGLTQADGTEISLSYSARWLPGGASLNSETGWFEWTPQYSHAGSYDIPLTLTATYTPADGGDAIETSVTRQIAVEVLNANAAPEFDAAETWNVLEGQPLNINVFAFDADNPGFEPKIRISPLTPVLEDESVPSTVTYAVSGLPTGASF
ncbi:MAG: hypothetical protein GY916_04335, partial [Gammaproteobacteria bacterium]|nr:hypothetical protein [Gammaproteobacteria bacterium]